MKLNYRPEIDGLRAIVVFAVILYDELHPSLKGAEMINELIMKEINKIQGHFKPKFMLLTAAVVDNKGIEGKDGTDFLKFMLAYYQGATYWGGTDIFPHDAGKQQSKELEHGMKIYLYTTDGVRDY